MTSSTSGLRSPCSSEVASGVVESNGSTLSWDFGDAEVLVQLSQVSLTVHIKSPMARYSARDRAKGSHILCVNVQASIGGAVSALIESMGPKR